jgi:hypothetical protein
MRIIKAAKKRDELIDTCDTCQSIIGLREVDVRWYSSAWSYVCPVCNNTNYFTAEDKATLFPWIMEDENDKEVQSDHPMRVNTL